jgi:cellulose synthase operon protein C
VDSARRAASLADRNEALAHGYFRKAWAAGRAAEALQWLDERFKRLGRLSPEPAQTLVLAHDHLAGTSSAKAVLETALTLRPEDAALRLFAARQFAEWNETPRAGALLAEVRAPASPAAWARTAAHLARRRGDLAEALGHWRKVLETEPLAHDAIQQAADLARLTDGLDGEAAFYTAAVARFPRYIPLRQFQIGAARRRGPAAAEPLLRELLAEAPANAWAWRELADVLIGLGRLDEANAALDAAAPLDPRAPALAVIRGEAMARAGLRAEARTEYRKALAFDIDHTYAMQALLNACDGGVERREAVRFLRTELARQSSTGTGILQFAGLARAFLEPRELFAVLSEAHAARPDLWHAWSVLIGQTAAINAMVDALDLAHRATARFPLAARLWVDLANVHHARAEREEQITALRRALEIEPAWGWAARELSDALVQANRFAEAEAVLSEALRRNPDDAATQIGLAHLLELQGRNAAALDALAQAARRAPGNDAAWDRLVRLAPAGGRPELPLQLAEELVGRRPGEAESWFRLSATLVAPADQPRSLEALDRALALNPRYEAAHFRRAMLLADQAKWDLALQACHPPVYGERPPPALMGGEALIQARRGDRGEAIHLMNLALAADPAMEWGWRRIAEWLHAEKRFDETAEAAERLTRLSPGDPVSFGFLASVRLKKGDRPGALEAFTRAFELRSDYDYAGRNLILMRLEDGQPDAAQRIFERLAPHLDVGPRAALQIKLACARSAQEDVLQVLRQLCATPAETALDANAVLDALREATKCAAAEPVLRQALLGGPVHPEIGALWVHVAHIPNIGVRRPLRRLDPATLVAKRAWAEWLNLEAGRIAEDRPRSAFEAGFFINIWRREWFNAAFRKRRSVWCDDDGIWSSVARILVEFRRYRAADRWTADWRTRKDVHAATLYNRLIAILHLGNVQRVEAYLREMTEGRGRNNFSARFDLLLGIIQYGNGSEDEAAASLARAANPTRQDAFAQVLFNVT